MKPDDKIIATLNGNGSDIEDTTGAATETSGEVLTEGSTPPVCDFCGEVRTDYPLPFLAQMVGAVYVSTVRHWRQNLDDDTENFYRAAYFAADSLVPRKLIPGKLIPGNAERA